MSQDNVVYLCVWSGDAKRALELVGGHYPEIEIREFPYRKLRASGFRERIRLLYGLRGKAFVLCFESLADCKHRQLLKCFQLLHRCRKTVLCDLGGRWQATGTIDVIRSGPGLLLTILRDVTMVAGWWIYLQLRLRRATPAAFAGSGDTEIVYLIPNPAAIGSVGGAISHIRGFLYGLKAAGIACRVFTGAVPAQDAFENEVVVADSRPYFFWEAAALRYNFMFARGVRRSLGSSMPQVLYQRHCRFSIAGAILSRRLQIPLILEYNGSEAWLAGQWDPNPLRRWIGLCEEVTLRSAARVVVVSEVLREQLLERGIAPGRIRVNPNAVDPDYFCPGRGRAAARKELDVRCEEVLVGFVGTFSLWHGIEILQQAIVRLLSGGLICRLRFVLMGDGLLQGEMRSALAGYEESGEVIFTGRLERHKVVEYLDASDILVSPHIPMPDGSRFFGSPTKLFEYMAMGKGIVASRLEQLAEVLEHEQTALLVTPGSVEELAEAIISLALDAARREALGAAARRAAVKRHSWAQNVAWALSDLPSKQVGSMAVSEEFHEDA